MGVWTSGKTYKEQICFLYKMKKINGIIEKKKNKLCKVHNYERVFLVSIGRGLLCKKVLIYHLVTVTIVMNKERERESEKMSKFMTKRRVLAMLLAFAMVLTGMFPYGITQAQAEPNVDEGLILHYDFDLQNSFATQINDTTGHGNAGDLKAVSGSVEGNYSIKTNVSKLSLKG